jgi:hypothetical protein
LPEVRAVASASARWLSAIMSASSAAARTFASSNSKVSILPRSSAVAVATSRGTRSSTLAAMLAYCRSWRRRRCTASFWHAATAALGRCWAIASHGSAGARRRSWTNSTHSAHPARAVAASLASSAGELARRALPSASIKSCRRASSVRPSRTSARRHTAATASGRSSSRATGPRDTRSSYSASAVCRLRSGPPLPAPAAAPATCRASQRSASSRVNPGVARNASIAAGVASPWAASRTSVSRAWRCRRPARYTSKSGVSAMLSSLCPGTWIRSGVIATPSCTSSRANISSR